MPTGQIAAATKSYPQYVIRHLESMLARGLLLKGRTSITYNNLPAASWEVSSYALQVFSQELDKK